MRALVTGATGFVGHALARRLLEIGWPTSLLIREARMPGPRGAPAGELREARIAELRGAGATVCAGDLADPNGIAEAAAGCDVLFHCAGESSPRASAHVLSWLNVAATENVVRAARHAGVARVVYLSCADVTLTGHDRLHWKEDVVLGRAPRSALARCKLLAEELALQASGADLAVAAVRPALLWGVGEQRLLPAMCAEARAGGVALFGSGETLLATTHVENAVDALVAAAQAKGAGGLSFHVTDAEDHTAMEFFTLLCRALSLGKPRRGIYALAYARAWLRQRREEDGAWPVDVMRRGRATLLDCLRAHSVLDFSPSTSVDEGMDELAAWARETGTDTIAQLARPAAKGADATHHEEVAAALQDDA